jgi:N utilization substance protein A
MNEGDSMSTELKKAIDDLVKEKNIKAETLAEAIENALITACKSHFGKGGDNQKNVKNVVAKVDRDTFEYTCYAEKVVVETPDEVLDELEQISLEDALKIKDDAEIGDIVRRIASVDKLQ